LHRLPIALTSPHAASSTIQTQLSQNQVAATGRSLNQVNDVAAQFCSAIYNPHSSKVSLSGATRQQAKGE
ncbi:MAG: hypothetical protein WA826_07115, partial [Silvibacterium sp.]